MPFTVEKNICWWQVTGDTLFLIFFSPIIVLIFWLLCYYWHTSRDSMSPIWRIFWTKNGIPLDKISMPTSFTKLIFINKPSVQARGADPSRCNSTNRQNPPIQQNRSRTNEVIMISLEIKNALNIWNIGYYMTRRPFQTVWAWRRHKHRFQKVLLD